MQGTRAEAIHIWGQGDLSILAITGYAIFEEKGVWNLEEVVLSVVTFSKLKHTGAHILSETQKTLSKVGLTLSTVVGRPLQHV